MLVEIDDRIHPRVLVGVMTVSRQLGRDGLEPRDPMTPGDGGWSAPARHTACTMQDVREHRRRALARDVWSPAGPQAPWCCAASKEPTVLVDTRSAP
jgi:hypothetical protein